MKCDHLQVIETITEKFHQYRLRNVGVAETRTSVDKWLKLMKAITFVKAVKRDLGII